MGEFGRSGGGPAGGQFPRPAGGETVNEHFDDLKEALEKDHQAEVIKKRDHREPRRRWFRRRR